LVSSWGGDHFIMSVAFPYLRRVKLLIGPLEEWRGGGDARQAITLEGDGTQNGFRIKFNITKHCISTASPSSIQIYNLSRGLRNSLQKAGAQIALFVGWDNIDYSLLFTGSLLNSYSARQGADIITTLLSNPAFGGMSKTIISKTFAGGTDVKTIVLDLAKSIPGVIVDPKNIQIENNATLGNQGLSMCAPTNSLLDSISRVHGFSWHVDNGVFYAVTDGKPLSSSGRVLIDPQNLLQAEPMLASPMQVRAGVSISCMLNPNIVPNGVVSLQTALNENINGDYVVHNLSHSGDTHGQSWESRIESWIVM